MLNTFHKIKVVPFTRAVMSTSRRRSYSTVHPNALIQTQPLRRTNTTHQPAWLDMPHRLFTISSSSNEAYAQHQTQNQVSPLTPPSTPPPGQALDFIKIIEVSPRDGLQNLPGQVVPTEIKVELVDKLVEAGLRGIEVGSFVRPDWVPQMADTPTLLPRLTPFGKVKAHYPVLVPNLRGLQNLLSLRQSTSQPLTDEIAIFIAASDSFSKANTHAPTSKIIAGLPPIFSLAAAQDPPLRVRAYISTVISCPFEGKVQPERVAELAEMMVTMGAYEVSLGDTTGEGGVEEWQAVWKAVTARIGTERVAAHTHDTFSHALPSLLSLLPLGLRTIDSSLAGLGGCPYSPGATGNVPTEDVVYALHKLGYRTGIDLEKLAETGEWLAGALGVRNESKVGRAVVARMKMREGKAKVRQESV